MVSDRAGGQLGQNGTAYAVSLVIAMATYWALGYAGLRYGAVVNLYVSPVWPSAGFALALILFYGYRFWPAIFVGALALNLEMGASWPVSGGIAAANTLSSLLAVYLLRRYADFKVQLTRLRDIVNLILVGALACRALSATLAVGALWLGGMVPAGEFGTLWLNRWIGGAVGVLVVTPFFLAFIEPVGRSRGAKWYAEALGLLVLLAAVSALVFTPLTPSPYRYYPLAFAPLPFIIWAAIRFEVRGAAVASLLLAVVSVRGTLNGYGPFGAFSRHEATLLLAVFNGIVAATGLFVAGGIAELKRERSLRAGLEVLRHAFDLIPVGVSITDEHGRLTVSNPASRRIWGGEQQVEPKEYGEYKGWRLSDRTLIEAHDWALARAIEKGETHIGEEIEIEGFDGARRVIRNSAMPLRDGESRIVGAIVVNEDITEMIRREQRLRELATIVEQTDDIVFVTDRSGIIEYVNPSFERSTGYSRDEAIGKTPAILKSGDQDQAFYKELWSKILSGAPFRQVLRNRNKTGELYYEEKTISPIRDFHGEIIHFVSTGKDITERKLADEALQQEHARLLKSQQELFDAHESLAEADRLECVGRLAAGVAHEVKNPLTIIRLGVDYLSKQFPQESNQEVLDDVRAAIDRAEHVIRDLLDFSRQNPFAPRTTNINEVIDNAIHLIKHEIDRRNIVIIRNRDDPMPPIYADPDRLVQVFINLLSNAAQAIGGDGRIEIVTRSICLSERDLEQAETSMLRLGEPVISVDIRDNGPGISAGHEKKLFEPFFTTKPVGEGSGLGLAVSRSIVTMHRGSISISNRPEGGASALLMFRVDREHLTSEKANTGSR